MFVVSDILCDILELQALKRLDDAREACVVGAGRSLGLPARHRLRGVRDGVPAAIRTSYDARELRCALCPLGSRLGVSQSKRCSSRVPEDRAPHVREEVLFRLRVLCSLRDDLAAGSIQRALGVRMRSIDETLERGAACIRCGAHMRVGISCARHAFTSFVVSLSKGA